MVGTGESLCPENDVEKREQKLKGFICKQAGSWFLDSGDRLKAANTFRTQQKTDEQVLAICRWFQTLSKGAQRVFGELGAGDLGPGRRLPPRAAMKSYTEMKLIHLIHFFNVLIIISIFFSISVTLEQANTIHKTKKSNNLVQEIYAICHVLAINLLKTGL